MALLTGLVVAGLAAALADREMRLRHALREAATDPLTGIANRRGLESAWRRLGGQPGVRLLFLDLVGFKAVNDRLGHVAGDRVLRDVACRLSEALPKSASLFRVGGDEFVVLGPPDVVQMLEASLAAPIAVPGAPAVSVGVRIGVAAGAIADLQEALANAQGSMGGAR